MNHPIRRYVLTMANEPLFFSALMGLVSFGGFLIYLVVSPQSQRLVWNRQAIVAVSRHWDCSKPFRSSASLPRSVWAGGHRCADRRQLSGLVADRGALFLRDVEAINWKVDGRHPQRRRSATSRFTWGDDLRPER